MTPTRFRIVLILSVLIGVVASFYDVVFPDASSPAAPVAADPIGSWASMAGWATAILLPIAGLVATAGLFLFRNWARPAAMIVTALELAAYPALGHWVHSGVVFSLMELSSILWGVVLASMFLSPIRERFSGGGRQGL